MEFLGNTYPTPKEIKGLVNYNLWRFDLTNREVGFVRHLEFLTWCNQLGAAWQKHGYHPDDVTGEQLCRYACTNYRNGHAMHAKRALSSGFTLAGWHADC